VEMVLPLPDGRGSERALTQLMRSYNAAAAMEY